MKSPRFSPFLAILVFALATTTCAPPLETAAPVQTRFPSSTASVNPTSSQATRPLPGQTPDPSPSPFPTETLFPALTQTPTPPGWVLLPPAAPGMPEGASPNGAWLWRVGPGEPGLENYQVLHLVKKDGSREWSVHFERGDFEKVYAEGAVGYTPIFWLPKEPYVFLAGRTCCGESAFKYENGFRLARLNLETGRLSVLISGRIQDHAYFSFSLTGTYLLYTQALRRGVHIQRLSSGEERLIQTPADFVASGQAFWSPDDAQVVMEACQAKAESSTRCSQRPLFLIVLDRSVFRLLVADTRELSISKQDAVNSIFWLNPGQISIHMASGSTWRLDLRSGERQCYAVDNHPCRTPTIEQ